MSFWRHTKNRGEMRRCEQKAWLPGLARSGVSRNKDTSKVSLPHLAESRNFASDQHVVLSLIAVACEVANYFFHNELVKAHSALTPVCTVCQYSPFLQAMPATTCVCSMPSHLLNVKLPQPADCSRTEDKHPITCPFCQKDPQGRSSSTHTLPTPPEKGQKEKDEENRHNLT